MAWPRALEAVIRAVVSAAAIKCFDIIFFNMVFLEKVEFE